MTGREVDEMVAAHCREVGMSKHKTAAEWGDRIRDGLKLTMVEVGELVADLAACEAELVLANNTVTDCETRMADIVAERDDLWRKLEEAERQAILNGKLLYERTLELGKLADASLAYAALREAADAVVNAWNSGRVGLRESVVTLTTALDHPVDGLSEEMRKYMRHKEGCEWYTRDDRISCTCGLDALLAKLGARP